MSEWKSRLDELVRKFEQERDELRLKLHLAKADVRDELAELDVKMAQFRERASRADDEARDAMGDIGDAARNLAEEIRQGFARVRSKFQDGGPR
jgi:hypothetical protein